MDVAEKLTLEELRANVGGGSAYVDVLSVDGEQTRVTLVTPDRRLEVFVPALPDPADYARPTALQTLLAVQIRFGGESLVCSVLGSSADSGPTRVSITIEQALRAAAAGIRTVFVTR